MAIYTTSKLALNAFRKLKLGSKQLLGNGKILKVFDQWKMSIFGSSSRNPNPTPDNGKFRHSLNQWSLIRLKQPRNNPLLLDFGRIRHGCVDKYEVYHFNKKSYLSKDYVLIGTFAIVAGLGATITYLSNLETIPYSKRTHFVIVPRTYDKTRGKHRFERFKKKNEGKILPPTHPTSIRVSSIAQNVIKALERGLRDDMVWGTPSYALRWWQTLKAMLHKDEQVDDVSSRATQYMEGIEWEVIVVDDPKICNAHCHLGGKIVMYTSYLDRYLKSDAEIAYVIGHEVAHAVARHQSEALTQYYLLLILEQFADVYYKYVALRKMSKFLMKMFLSRKREEEADYIGLLLMASAGYHPHNALIMRERRAKLRGDENDFKSTHPSAKKRAQFAAQAQEEAMAFYKKSLVNY